MIFARKLYEVKIYFENDLSPSTEILKHLQFHMYVHNFGFIILWSSACMSHVGGMCAHRGK